MGWRGNEREKLFRNGAGWGLLRYARRLSRPTASAMILIPDDSTPILTYCTCPIALSASTVNPHRSPGRSSDVPGPS
jgi:hypothetical protein